MGAQGPACPSWCSLGGLVPSAQVGEVPMTWMRCGSGLEAQQAPWGACAHIPIPTQRLQMLGSGQKATLGGWEGASTPALCCLFPSCGLSNEKTIKLQQIPPQKRTSRSLWEMIFPQWGEQGWGWLLVIAKHTRSLSQHGHIPVPGPRQHRPAAWARAAPRCRHRASFSPARPLVQAPVTPSNAFFFSSLLWGWNYSGFVRKKKKKMALKCFGSGNLPLRF